MTTLWLIVALLLLQLLILAVLWKAVRHWMSLLEIMVQDLTDLKAGRAETVRHIEEIQSELIGALGLLKIHLAESDSNMRAMRLLRRSQHVAIID